MPTRYGRRLRAATSLCPVRFAVETLHMLAALVSENIKNWSEVGANTAQVVAILVGGWWA